jgi:hypothetical protein
LSIRIHSKGELDFLRASELMRMSDTAMINAVIAMLERPISANSAEMSAAIIPINIGTIDKQIRLLANMKYLFYI